jgi:sec-independent protein translocase protein TatA
LTDLFFAIPPQIPTNEYLNPQLSVIAFRRRPVTMVEMPGNIGLPEIAIVLVIALIVFGPKRLPELGRSLGRGIREFKGSIGGEHDDDDDDGERRKTLSTSQAATAPVDPARVDPAPVEPAPVEPAEAEVSAPDKRG